MKKAKQVEVPLDRALTAEEVMKLLNHAISSASFSAVKYDRTTHQLRQKLFDKGYPSTPVEATKPNGESYFIDLVETALEKVVESGLADDHAWAERRVNSLLSKSGERVARQKLRLAGIDEAIVDEAIARWEEEESERAEFSFHRSPLEVAATKITRPASFKKLPQEKAKQKFTRTMMSKGFDLYESLTWLEENYDLDAHSD